MITLTIKKERYKMDIINVDFPLEHERCFSYEHKQEIVDKVSMQLQNNEELISLLEKNELDIIELCYENKVLYRCSKTEQERENELCGLRNNRIYFTYTYYYEREQCYIEKTYGPGAYFLEQISEHVYEHNPFIHKLIYTNPKLQRVLELTVREYNRITVLDLWCFLSRNVLNLSPHILFAAWLKNIKHVDILKIIGSDYYYPIIIFL